MDPAEVKHFVDVVVDPATGLVRTDRAFSAHRDTFRNARPRTPTRWSPCSDGSSSRPPGRRTCSRTIRLRPGAIVTAVAAVVVSDRLGLLLRRHFWMDDRFRDRLGTDETSGEANVWPFHLGLIEDAGDAT